jgi:glycine oxidase
MGQGERPFLIVGQGLAGTALGWRLRERGVPFVIVDRDEPLTCSKVAAGLVTPITGMRLNLNWRFTELRDEAEALYRVLEARWGQQIYFALDQVRLFRDAAARELFRRRLEDPAVAVQVTRVDWGEGAMRLLDDEVFAASQGGFEQTGGGYLDTARYLAASRQTFAQEGCWQQGEVASQELELTADGTVGWRGAEYAAVIFCQGWEAAGERWFDWLPFQSARGSIITAQAGGLGGEQRVVNSSGCWVLPRADGSLRIGPTYEPQFDPAQPHEADPARLEGLREKVARLVRPAVTWQEVQTAVRPIIARAKLVLGRHPQHEQVGFFNGLGSKGALRAPWAARQLVAHWLDGTPLEPELDLRQNW